MKKSIIFLLVVFILFSICPTAYALDYNCNAQAAIIYQPDSKEILYEKNAKSAHFVASTTKILTALVVLESTDTDSIVEILPSYTNIEGSSMYLKAGERFSVKELLYGGCSLRQMMLQLHLRNIQQAV